MKIGGFQKFSIIDYPGKVCAVIFTQGCNFKCSFCHNPELISIKCGPYLEKEILRFLKKRVGVLDGVVISGGEPTIQKGLVIFLKKIKKMGFLVKIDTNGSNPHVLQKIIDMNLVDFISMSIKSTFVRYDVVAGVKVDVSDIDKSICVIENFAKDYEFQICDDGGGSTVDIKYILSSYVKDKTKCKIQKINNMRR